MKIYNSLRVHLSSWADDAAFDELLCLLRDYRDCVQQVAFFSSDFHPPLPLALARAHADVLRGRIRRVKAEGFSCGINVLATVGHHPERMDEALQGDWRRATDADGNECPASFCPADERYQREYVGPLYECFCAAEPDFLWIDDDVRLQHAPIGDACFCDGCIRVFNAEYGHSFTRAALKEALAAPDTALRKQWLSHQSEKIARLLRFIRRTVNACDDRIELGFMTGERYAEGYDFLLWADALSDGGKYEILWRPGGGAYSDRPFEEIEEKAKQLGRQCAGLPACVTGIQSEIENFPYRVLQKSPRSTALEVLMDVGTGCTGAALNILPTFTSGGEGVGVTRGHFDAIRAAYPFEKLLSDRLGRAPTAGVYDGWHRRARAALPDFFRGSGDRFARAWRDLFSLGLPECFDAEQACCFLLTGDAPRAYSEEELLRILSAGVYMDGEALSVLNELGFGELTGFRVGETFREDRVEVYAEHPINRGFEGKCRRCPQIFVRGSSAALIPPPGAETLARLTDYRGAVAAECAMGLYRNRLGGRVCVCAHYATADMGDTMKSVQIKRIFRALSGDTLPFLTESCVRLQAVVRRTERGVAAVLLNPNLDRLTDVAVLFAGKPARLEMIGEDMRPLALDPAGTDGAMTRFILPDLPPYSMALLTPLD